jgi:glycine cleavage system regulatory protein
MSPSDADDDSQLLDGPPETTLDEQLELLADRDRRVVLATLLEHGDERLPVGVLTDVVARSRPEAVSEQTVLTALHHVHLPKLDCANVIEYDAEASLVTYRGDERLEHCLGAIRPVDDR